MKLSTMTLPTGEFLLVVSGKTNAAADEIAGWQVIRDSIGAACVIWSAEDIEVENALFDVDARRREPDPDLDFTPDQLLLDRIAESKYFSPAGLVKTPAEDLLPDPFPKGATVKIVGPPHYHHGEDDVMCLGVKGRVLEPSEGDVHDLVYVKFTLKDAKDPGPYRWHFPKSSLEPATATLEEPDEEDD